jgi:hypothetical protein
MALTLFLAFIVDQDHRLEQEASSSQSHRDSSTRASWTTIVDFHISHQSFQIITQIMTSTFHRRLRRKKSPKWRGENFVRIF